MEFSQNTAGQFIRVAREFSNSESVKNLGSKKLFSLLSIPQEEREDFISQLHEVNGQTKIIHYE